MTSKLNLSGYQVSQLIHRGHRNSIYRGTRELDGLPVIIKIPISPLPSKQQLIQLRHQYAVTKDLDLPNVSKTLALVAYQNAYALITEDCGGISLNRWLEREGAFCESPQKIRSFLLVAIQLARVLAELYGHRIVHKDIKPANILYNPDTQQIQLIDFSVASLLPKETPIVENYSALEGTLAYIAPEQTGRMNRGLDYRCDFYALGVTFYELLTGKLPFAYKNARELVHAHIARIPTPAQQVRAEIPEILSALVGKLMSKNAEDRYQNALGLKYDLELCLLQLQANGQICSFDLGSKDLSDRFAIPNRLYGREREISTLLAAFDRACQGHSVLTTIAGESGIGKTALVSEIYPRIVAQNSFFGAGKFDRFKDNIPISALAQASGEIVRRLFAESNTEFQHWRERILAAVGDNGQVLIDIIPDLERVIGGQNPVPELSGTAAQQRLYLVFQKFIGLFATAERPLVIFLDNLQWADLASLNLLQSLLEDRSISHLLVLAAYRDDEVTSDRSLNSTIDEIQNNGTEVELLTIQPLEFSAIARLVADTLHCELDSADPLARLVEQKTQGNPLFIIQFLQVLYQGGQINFHPRSCGWQCNFTEIKTLALTNDILAFTILQLQSLPSSTQELIKLAACIGGSFDLQTIAAISKDSIPNLGKAIWRALELELLIPTTDTYKFFTPSNGDLTIDNGEESSIELVNPTYQFLHDRIQQAAYALIPSNERPKVHLKIARLLQQNYPERVFDIANHCNQGLALLTQTHQLIELVKLNLVAGEKAKKATAYAAANDYLQVALNILPNNAWETEYQLTLALHNIAAEVTYLNGDLAAMEKLYETVLRSARGILDKVEIYRLQVTALTARGKMLEAIDVGIEALAQLGIDIPKQPDEDNTRLALQELERQLDGRQIEDLIDLPVMRDIKAQKTIELFSDLLPPTFISIPGLYPLLNTKMVSLSVTSGNIPVSAVAYVSQGLVMSAFFNDIEVGYRFGLLALKLINSYNSQAYNGKTLLVFGNWIYHRHKIIHTVTPFLKTGYIASLEAGDFLNAGYNLNFYFDATLLAGMYVSDWEVEIAAYSQELESVKQYSAKAYLDMKQQIARNLLVTVDRPWCLIGDVYDETVMLPKHQQDGDLTALAYAYIYKLMLAYIFGNYVAAMDNIDPAQKYMRSLSGMMPIPVFHFYAALTYLAQLPQAKPDRQIALDRVNTHQAAIDLWAKDAPINYQHKSDLIEAEKQRSIGNTELAIEYYNRAIAGAKEHQFTHEEALANELAARFCLAQDRSEIALAYLSEAYYCYDRWGAKAKSAQLIEHYPQLLTAIDNLAAQERVETEIPTDLTVAADNSEALDLATLIEASQNIAREVELDRLLIKFLNIIITNAGADKCVLLLKQEGTLQEIAIVECDTEAQLLVPTSLEICLDVPISIVNKVERHLQSIEIADLSNDRYVNEDAYFLHYQPKCCLCLPILHQGQSIGIIYLENHTTKSSFTPERVKLIEILVAQAAISIENAKLYSRLQASVDLLEEKVAERTAELKAAKDRAEASEREKTSLFNHINHELRDPLNAVLGMSEGLLNSARGELNPQQRRCVEVIAQSGRHQLELIDDILDYAKIEADKLELYREPTDLQALCEESLSFVRLQAERKNIQLDFHIPADLPNPTIDRRRIRQVLINLLSNAIKFTPDHGSVRIEAAEFVTLLAEPGISLSVIDTGIGISSTDISRLFQPFVQIDSPEGRKAKGTGLGLNLVKKIVALHGGGVRVTSEVGSGSQFIVDLPSEDLPIDRSAGDPNLN